MKDIRSITTPGGALHVLNDALLNTTAGAKPYHDASTWKNGGMVVQDEAGRPQAVEEDAKSHASSPTETSPNVDDGKEAMQFGAGDDSREGETSAGKDPVCWSSEEITGWSVLGSIGIRR